jgi:hypothetical protein
MPSPDSFTALASRNQATKDAAANTDEGVKKKAVERAKGKPLPSTPNKNTQQYDSETNAEYKARLKSLGYATD